MMCPVAVPNNLSATALSREAPGSAMNPWISIATDGTPWSAPWEVASLRRTVFLVGLKPTTKLMAQHLFGRRRRVMLSFERQPLPGACHVDQDVPHSQGRRALGHLTTFDRVLSALHR